MPIRSNNPPALRRPRKAALRVSGLDRGQECPVGFAGVEEASDSVVPEVGEPEREAFDASREVVDCFGRFVGDVGAVPGEDLVAQRSMVR